MKRKLLIIGIFLGIVFLAGCRTGEYKVDLLIYEEMPALLAANEQLASNLEKDENGNLRVEFEKGTMYLYLRAGSDMNEERRQVAASDALVIFHQAYMDHPENLREKGGFFRETIYSKTYVEDIELYVMEWDMDTEDPEVTNNRSGNFF